MILLGSFWLVLMCCSGTKFYAVRRYEFIRFPNFVTEIEHVCHKAEGLIILGMNITYSDTLPDTGAFASEFNITFPILLDKDGAVAERLYQIPGVPTSILINRDGTIERVQVGVMNGKQIRQYVAEILR